MHYTPSSSRFIVSSTKCSTKSISRLVSNAFKLIFNQIQNFHAASKFYKNYNRFWVINNSKPLIERLDVINTRKKAKDISTFDFSTLYTKLPHRDLIKVLNSHIEFAFDGGTGNYLGYSDSRVFWKKKAKRKATISRFQLMALVKHLITRTYFVVGNLIIRQSIGIPMGIDPAPFWANLYLYKFENSFMESLRRSDVAKSRKFHGCARFIDDLVCLNDGGEFKDSYKEIYPNELELKCEHHEREKHATFLDLDIKISGEEFIYKMFDKRDEFSFSVVRMPYIDSNIPSYIFYGTILSEIVRIARSTLLLDDLIPRLGALFKRMLIQGADRWKIIRQCKKAMDKHELSFRKFASRFENIREKMIQELNWL